MSQISGVQHRNFQFQSVSAVPDEDEIAFLSPESSLLIQSSYQICVSGQFYILVHRKLVLSWV